MRLKQEKKKILAERLEEAERVKVFPKESGSRGKKGPPYRM